MKTEAEFRAAVDAGARWLDTNYPDWLDKVVVNEFDIKSGCRCVLGQLFRTEAAALIGRSTYDDPEAISGFEWARHSILNDDQLTSYGFDAQIEYSDSTDLEYEILQKLWLEKIASYSTTE